MIGPFTRVKSIPYSSGSNQVITLYTTTKKSMVSVELIGSAQSMQIAVEKGGNNLEMIFEQEGGSTNLFRTYSPVLSAGVNIRLTNFNSNFVLHVFEME